MTITRSASISQLIADAAAGTLTVVPSRSDIAPTVSLSPGKAAYFPSETVDVSWVSGFDYTELGDNTQANTLEWVSEDISLTVTGAGGEWVLDSAGRDLSGSCMEDSLSAGNMDMEMVRCTESRQIDIPDGVAAGVYTLSISAGDVTDGSGRHQALVNGIATRVPSDPNLPPLDVAHIPAELVTATFEVNAFPPYDSITTPTVSLSVGQPTYYSSEGTVDVNWEIGFDYQETADAATRAATLEMASENLSLTLTGGTVTWALGTDGDISGDCNQDVSNTDGDPEMVRCTGSFQVDIPGDFVEGVHTLSIPAGGVAAGSGRHQISVNGFPYRPSAGAEPYVAAQTASVTFTVNAFPPYGSATPTVSLSNEKTLYYSSEPVDVTWELGFDYQEVADESRTQATTLEMASENLSLTLAGGGVTWALGTDRDLSGNCGQTVTNTTDGNLERARCTGSFQVTVPDDFVEGTHTLSIPAGGVGAGLGRHRISVNGFPYRPSAGAEPYVAADAVDIAFTVTAFPPYGSATLGTPTLATGKPTYFSDEAVDVRWDIDFDYQEMAGEPRTRADVLELVSENVSITVTGAGGEEWTLGPERDLSGNCRRLVTNGGDGDLETARCSRSFRVDIPDGVAEGAHTLSIPAGAVAPGSGRHQMRVNGFPHRASAGAEPYEAAAAVSVVFTVVHDTVPVFEDSGPHVYQGGPGSFGMRWSSPPPVGGNGQLRYTYADPRIPGLRVTPESTGVFLRSSTPLDGRHIFRLTVTDSDSAIDPGRADDVTVRDFEFLFVPRPSGPDGSVLSFVSDSVSGVEGSTLNLLMQLSLFLDEPEDLVFTVGADSDGSTPDATLDDYTNLEGTTRITLPNEVTRASIRISLAADDVVDGGEVLSVGLVSGSPFYSFGTPASVLVTVLDRLSMSGGTTLAEGQGRSLLTVRAGLGATVAADFPVTLSVGPGSTATRGRDYTIGLPPTLVISAGMSVGSVTVPVSVIGDDRSEPTERVLIVGESAGRTGKATVTVGIADDEPAPPADLRLLRAGSRDPVREGETARFDVVLAGDAGGAVSVPWQVAARSEAGVPDVAVASGTVEFSAAEFSSVVRGGARARSFDIPVLADGVAEFEERLVVEVGEPFAPGAPGVPLDRVRVSRGEADVLVAESDTVRLSLSGPAALTEAGTGSYTVSAHGGALPSSVTVALSATPATAASLPASVALGPRDRSVVFDIGAADDADSDDVLVTVALGEMFLSGAPPFPVSDARPALTVSVRDDEASASVSFDAATYGVVEGGPPVLVTVTLDRVPVRPVDIPVLLSRTGETMTLTARFGADDLSQALELSVPADSVGAAGATWDLRFASPLPANVALGASPTVAVVTHADAAVSLSATPLSLTEGGSGEQTVTVTAAIAAARAQPLTVTLDVVAPGSTAEAADFSGTSGLAATILAGELEGTATFALVDDTAVETGERAVIGGSTAGGDAVSRATVSITDGDDTAPLGIALSPGSPSFREGARVSLDITLGAAVDASVEVPWELLLVLDGATADDVVPPLSGTVTFAAGAAATQRISLSVRNDDLSEAAESVGVRLGTPTVSDPALEGRVTVSDDREIGEIAHSDRVRLSLSGPAEAVEGQVAAYAVRLDNIGTEDVTVTVTVTGTTASAPGDFTQPTPTPLTIPAGESAGTVSVTLADDNLFEMTETVTVSISGAQGGGGPGAEAASGGAALVTTGILDDDVSVSFGASSYVATEDGVAARVTVTLDQVLDRAVSVPLSVAPQGEADPADLAAALPGAVEFAAGERAVAFEAVAANDRFDDDNESFLLVLDAAPAARVKPGALATATLSITDNDAMGVSNAPPAFDDAADRSWEVAEDAVSGATVGDPLGASDPDSDPLHYSLTGADAALFGITPSGQMTLARGARLDHETDPTLNVTVGVSDRLNDMGMPDPAADASVAVMVSVTDAEEPPSAPGRPTLAIGFAPAPSFALTMGARWDAPENPGPAITRYDVRVRETGAVAWAEEGVHPVGPSLALAIPQVGRTYDVQVRAVSPEGTGPWSETATGSLDLSRLSVRLEPGAATSLAEADGMATTVTMTATVLGLDSAVPGLALSLDISPGTATEDGDFTATSPSGGVPVVLPDTEILVTVTVTDDRLVERDETFVARVAMAGIDSNPVTLTITDSDTATLSVGGLAGNVAEGGTATVTVTLSDPVDSGVDVTLLVSGDPALSAADTGVTAGTLAFPAGAAAELPFEVAITDDNLSEGEEVFSVSISGSSSAFGARVAVDASLAAASATIAASDPIDLTAGVSAAQVSEGDSLVLSVDLSGGVGTEPITVDYEVGGPPGGSEILPAIAGDDYTLTSSALTVGRGAAAGSVTISILSDTTAEPDKEMRITLSNERGGGEGSLNLAAGADSTVTVTITGDFGTVSLSADRTSFAEGEGLAGRFTLSATIEDGGTVTGPDDLPLRLMVARGSSTAETGDYVFLRGSDFATLPASSLSTLTIGAGQGSVTAVLVLDATEDAVAEPDETVVIGGRGTGYFVRPLTLTIDDDDTATLSFDISEDAVAENAGATRPTVRLDGEVEAEIALEVAAGGGSATGAGGDYDVTPFTLTIAPNGQPFGGPAINIVNDTLSEPAETVPLSFVNVSSALSDRLVLEGGTVTIAASDPLTLDLSGPSRTEEAGGIAVYAVAVSGGESTEDVTVRVGVDTDAGTAAAGADHGVPGTPLVIPAGASLAVLEMRVIDDTEAEDDETFVVTLSDPSGGGGGPDGISLGADSRVTTTITDDDHREVTVSFRPPLLVAVREGVSLTATLALDQPPGREVAIPVLATPVRGADAIDYQGVPATATFPAEATLARVTLGAVDDAADDDGEGFVLSLGDLPGQVFSAAPLTLEVDIIDNDGRGPFVALSASVPSIAESADPTVVTVTAEVNGAGVLRAPLEVPLSFGAGGAGDDDHDTSARLPTVTVAAGSLAGSATLTLSPVDDAIVEADEPVRLVAEVPGYEVDAGTVLVIDDDTAQLAITGPATAVRESDGFADFRVTLSRQVDAAVTVTVQTADGTALDGEDYTAVTTTLTLPANGAPGDGRQFRVSVDDDPTLEGEESFSARIVAAESPLLADISFAGSDTATATINASDRLLLSLSAPPGVAEDAGAATFTVWVAEGTAGAPVEVSARILPESTATDVDDYTGPVGSPLTLAAGEASVTFELPLVDDAVDDDSETVVVEIFAPSGGGGGPGGIMLDRFASTATVTIVDNDEVVVASFPSARVSVSEGSAASVTVSLSEPPGQALTVSYTVSGEPAEREDPGAGQLVIAAGEAEGAIRLVAVDDDLPEQGEEFLVTLQGAEFGGTTDDVARLGGVTVATVGVRPSDAVVLSLAGVAGAQVAEGRSVTYRVVALGLWEENTAPITVDVDVTGGAGVTEDDFIGPGPVTLDVGVFSTPLTLSALADGVSDPDETLTLSLSGATGGSVPLRVDPGALTATIVETNAPPTFGAAPGVLTRRVAENSVGAAVGAPVAASDPDRADVLSYTLEDDPDPATAPAASLFGITGAGQITVRAATPLDHEAADTHTVVVAVSDGRDRSGAADPAVDARVTVVIGVTDVDEPPPAPAAPAVGPADNRGHRNLTVGWAAPPSAGIPPITGYDVERKRADEGDSAYTAAGIAQSGTQVSATLFGLEPGTRYDVRVRAVNDEGDGAWSPAGSGSTDRTHRVSWSGQEVTVAEGQVATLTAVVDNASTIDIAVDYTVTNIGADADDYSDPGAGALTIPMGATVATVEIPVAEDNEPEVSEALVVSLRHVSQVGETDNRAEVGTPAEFTVTIATSDNDAPVVTLRGPANRDVNEGDTLEHTVALVGANNSADPVTVGISVGGSATSPDDFVALPPSVTIAAGSASAPLRITAVADDVRDPGETIVVMLGSATGPAGITVDTGAVLTATIVEAGSPPSFALDTAVRATRAVRENSPAGTGVGSPLPASDPDGDPLTFTLEETGLPPGDAGHFGIDGGGRITVAAGAAVDHETATRHTVVVGVSDGRDARGLDDPVADDVVTVLVTVVDTDEVPPAPSVPVVGPAAQRGAEVLTVRWTLPDAPGAPPVSAHVVEYRYREQGADRDSVRLLAVGADTAATLLGLKPDTPHHVRVRAVNDEGAGPWSPPGVGRTDPAESVVSALTASLGAAEGEIVTVSVGMDSARTVPVTVNYRIDARGASPADFSDPGAGEAVIPAGMTVAGIAVGLVDDSVAEPPEELVVVLVSVTDGTSRELAVLGDGTETTVTIAAGGLVALSLSTGDRLVSPGGTATLTVSVSGDTPAGDMEVELSVGGDATAGTDFAALPDTVTVGVADSSVTLDVSVLAGAAGGRTVEVGLGAVVEDAGGTVRAAAAEVTLTIAGTNSDPFFPLPRATVTIGEGAAAGATADMAVTAVDPDNDPIAYSLSGAEATLFTVGGDGVLALAAGATLDYEARTRHTVVLEAGDAKGELGVADPGTDASVTVVVDVADAAEPPLAPGSLDVNQYGNDPARALSVRWQAPENAGRPPITGYIVEVKEDGQPNSAYSRVPHAGTGTHLVIRNLRPSTEYNVRVRALNRDGAGTGATRTHRTLPGHEITMAARTLDVAEDAGTAEVRVTVDAGAPAGGLTVDYRVRDVEALEGVDYTVPQSLSIVVPSGSNSGVITLTVVDDAVAEQPETFVVALVGASAGGVAIIGEPSETTVTIGASDSTVAALSVPATVDVGDPVTAVIALSGNTQPVDFTVTYGGSAVSGTGNDYTTDETGLPASVEITALSDATPGAEIEVTVGTDNANVLLVAPTATVTIVDPPTGPPLFDMVDRRLLTIEIPEDAMSPTPLPPPLGETYPVTPGDHDATLTYTLEGVARDLFKIQEDVINGGFLIRYEPDPPGPTLDHESAPRHTVTAAVSDGKSGDTGAVDVSIDASLELVISVTDVPEPPGAPSVTLVEPAPVDGDHALVVEWDVPANTGPPIRGYRVEHKRADQPDSAFTADNVSGSGTSAEATIHGLDPGVEYDVRVRALNNEGTGAWTDEESGTTAGAGTVNDAPVFDSMAHTVSVVETALAGVAVGDPIGASDNDLDTLTYTLSGSDAFSVRANAQGRAQIVVATAGVLDYESIESDPTLTVTLGVGDGKDASGAADTAVDANVAVTIEVLDDLEPPPAPGGLALAASVDDDDVRLVARWSAPDTAGIPPVLGYEVVHKRADEDDSAFTRAGVSHAGTETTATISGLEPDVSYDVRVRARNDEGVGGGAYARGVIEGGVDLDADGNGVVEARDGLYLFYTFQFGGILGRDAGLRDIVFDNLASRTRPPTRTNGEILEFAEALDASDAPAFDIDGNGVVEARDALYAFYTWQFGGILGRDAGLRDIVFDNLASRTRLPTRTNGEILEYANSLATPGG